MRIMYCNTALGRGGAARIATDLCKQVSNNGIEVLYAYSDGNPAADFEIFVTESGLERHLNALTCRVFDNDGFSAKQSTRRIVAECERFKPDVFHLHNAHGYYLSIERLLDYLNKVHIPLVWTFHDFWPLTGHCVHFRQVDCQKWRDATCDHCPQKKSYPSSLVCDMSNVNAKRKKSALIGIDKLTIVTPSRWMADVISDSYIGSRSILPIYNGIDLNSFHPVDSTVKEKFGLLGKKVVLGVANGWGDRKGYRDFVEISKSLPDDFKVVMIGFTGDIPNDLPKSIIALPRLNSISELVNWYSAAEVLVNASRDETFGLVTVEAMACGTPVALYDYCANSEIVNSNTGILCDSLIELKNAVTTICEIGKSTYQVACVERARSFTLEHMAHEYMALYSSIIGTSNKG